MGNKMKSLILFLVAMLMLFTFTNQSFLRQDEEDDFEGNKGKKATGAVKPKHATGAVKPKHATGAKNPKHATGAKKPAAAFRVVECKDTKKSCCKKTEKQVKGFFGNNKTTSKALKAAALKKLIKAKGKVFARCEPKKPVAKAKAKAKAKVQKAKAKAKAIVQKAKAKAKKF